MEKSEQWPGFKVPPNDPTRDVLKPEPEPREPEAEERDDEDYDYEDTSCERCGGTGGEPMDDGCTPCEDCDGEGYKWWL